MAAVALGSSFSGLAGQGSNETTLDPLRNGRSMPLRARRFSSYSCCKAGPSSFSVRHSMDTRRQVLANSEG